MPRATWFASIPRAMSVWRRIVWPAPVASAACRLPHEGPLRGRPPVVEDGLAHELDLDAALEAFHGPDQQVVGVAVRRRSRVRGDEVLPLGRTHRQRVPDHDPAVGVFHVVSTTFVPGT